MEAMPAVAASAPMKAILVARASAIEGDVACPSVCHEYDDAGHCCRRGEVGLGAEQDIAQCSTLSGVRLRSWYAVCSMADTTADFARKLGA